MEPENEKEVTAEAPAPANPKPTLAEQIAELTKPKALSTPPVSEAPKTPVAPVAPEANQKHTGVVQTFAADMAGVLETDKSGLIKKIIHGEEEHEAERKNLSPQSKKNKVFMLLGILFVLVSLGLLTFFFLKREAPTVSVAPQFVPLIYTDKSAIVEVKDLKKNDLEQAVLREVNTNGVKLGGVEGIYLTVNNDRVGLRKFIPMIDGALDIDKNPYVDDNFLMGVYKNDYQDNNYFILFKMRSIPDVFDAMHAWENKMFVDLYGFFGVNLSPTTKYLLTKNFENGIIENKNARILYDNNNKIVMAYVFADDHTVVITDSENAVRELILRLSASEIKK